MLQFHMDFNGEQDGEQDNEQDGEQNNEQDGETTTEGHVAEKSKEVGEIENVKGDKGRFSVTAPMHIPKPSSNIPIPSSMSIPMFTSLQERSTSSSDGAQNYHEGRPPGARKRTYSGKY